MRLTREQWIIAGTLVGAVVVLGLVALNLPDRDGAEVAAVDDTSGATTTSVATESSLTTTSTSQAPVTTSPTTESAPTTANTTAPSDTDIAPADTFDRAGQDRRLLIELSNGVELVAYSDPGDVECERDTLAAEKKGNLLFVYDELDNEGGLTAHVGPFDQLAISGSCEEFTSGIWMTYVGGLSGIDIVEFDTIALDPRIFSIAELRWFATTGWFGGDATFYDGDEGWVDTVVFEPGHNRTVPWADAFGTRLDRSDASFDLILPSSWQIVDDHATGLQLGSNDSDAWVRVEIIDVELPTGRTEPGPSETEQMRYSSRVAIWTGTLDRALQTEWHDADNILYVGPDGSRLVQRYTTGGRTVTVEAFTPISSGHVDIDVPSLVLESVRVFSSYG